MDLILRAIKALIRKLEGELGRIATKVDALKTPDWSQNDPSAADYIRGRTHYETFKETTVLDETISKAADEEGWVSYSYSSSIELVEGLIYKLYLDGEYVGEGVSNGSEIPIVHNTVWIEADKLLVSVGAQYTADSYAVKITTMNPLVKQLDEKYIPETIARTDEVMLNTNPTATGSFSLGRKAGTAVGQNSVAIGYNVTASGSYSHAEGETSYASGYASHAEGYFTTASGRYSHAEGCYAKANGQYSHAEGCKTTASSGCSHAEGSNTTASSGFSHAEGYFTTASGNSSHAEGYKTTASGDSSHVQGKFNVADSNNKYAHIVGNGKNESSCSNAHTLDWNGVGWFQGGLQVGGNAQDDGSQTVMLNGDKEIIIASSTTGSVKKFKITVDDSGTISATLVE